MGGAGAAHARLLVPAVAYAEPTVADCSFGSCWPAFFAPSQMYRDSGAVAQVGGGRGPYKGEFDCASYLSFAQSLGQQFAGLSSI